MYVLVYFFFFICILSQCNPMLNIYTLFCLSSKHLERDWAPYELERALFGAMNAPMTFNVSWKSFSNNTSKCFPLLFGWCCYFPESNLKWIMDITLSWFYKPVASTTSSYTDKCMLLYFFGVTLGCIICNKVDYLTQKWTNQSPCENSLKLSG